MNAPLPEHIRKALETVTLDDKYSLDYGRAFMSGVQALVKLPMLQRLRDAQAGKNTAGFISGYRGSPLGGYDQALWKAEKYLKAQNIVFQPGVNEELAATALWGTQQLGFTPARDAQVRRRVRHLVRQGPGRGPQLRRLQARQHGGHHALGRRDRGGGRRPRRQELHRRAPERPHLQGLRPAGVLPGQRAGNPRPGHPRLRHEPLRRRLGRHEDDPGDRRVQRHGHDRPRARRDPHSHRLRDAARRRAHPLAGPRAGAGSAPVRLQVVRGAGVHPRQPPELQRHRRPERPLRPDRQRQGLQRHAPGADGPGPGRRRPAASWASACTRSAWCGRWKRRARANSPRACARSWWSRKSARSSNTS